MPSATKREKEQYYFEMFRRSYPLPEGRMEYGDKPDVVLHGKTRIGIEVTNFFLEKGAVPASEQVQKKAREEVVTKAYWLYQGKHDGRFELWFTFDKQVPIREPNATAAEIAKLPTRIDLEKTGQLSKNVFRHIPELSRVYLNAREYDDAWWRVSHTSDSYPTMSLDRLKEIIFAKEEKSKEYRRCDAYWLLVVVDFMDRAQDQEIHIDGFETLHSAMFQNIIVYKTHFGHFLETNPAAQRA